MFFGDFRGLGQFGGPPGGILEEGTEKYLKNPLQSTLIEMTFSTFMAKKWVSKMSVFFVSLFFDLKSPQGPPQ